MAENLVELEGGPEATVGFHPLLGVDDRAVAKGIQRNDAFNNINAFDSVLRQRDDAYYSNMPMNTVETDPSNMNKDKEAIDILRATLQQRIASLYMEDQPPLATTNSVEESPLSLQPSTGWAGLVQDLKSWNTLPVQPGWSRVRYVITRDNRTRWLILFIVIIMIVGYVTHICMKK
jgi:hypothetical protein